MTGAACEPVQEPAWLPQSSTTAWVVLIVVIMAAAIAILVAYIKLLREVDHLRAKQSNGVDELREEVRELSRQIITSGSDDGSSPRARQYRTGPPLRDREASSEASFASDNPSVASDAALVQRELDNDAAVAPGRASSTESTNGAEKEAVSKPLRHSDPPLDTVVDPAMASATEATAAEDRRYQTAPLPGPHRVRTSSEDYQRARARDEEILSARRSRTLAHGRMPSSAASAQLEGVTDGRAAWLGDDGAGD